jgi:hypothetical protein
MCNDDIYVISYRWLFFRDFGVLQELRECGWDGGADTGGGRSQSLTQAPQERARLRCEDDIQKCLCIMLEKGIRSRF